MTEVLELNYPLAADAILRALPPPPHASDGILVYYEAEASPDNTGR